MDHFMDKHVVMDYHIKLVALTCLLVAGMLGTSTGTKYFTEHSLWEYYVCVSVSHEKELLSP